MTHILAKVCKTAGGMGRGGNIVVGRQEVNLSFPKI